MGLEDTTAKYTVQIVQEGTTAPAVQEFNNLRAAAQNAAGGAQEATKGLHALRESSIVTREGMRALNEAIILTGGTAFPELTRSVMLARDAMMLTRGAALLTGASLTAVLGVGIAAMTPLVITAVEGWRAYKAGIEEADSEARLFAQTQSAIARGFTAIDAAQKNGLISADNFARIDALLKIGTEHSLQTAQQLMGRLGVSNNSVAGYEQLQSLENKMHQSTMEHFDQERAKAYEVFNQRLAEIKKLMAVGGITTAEGQKAQQGAEGEYNSRSGSIFSAQQEKQAADLIKQIDEDLFLYQQNLGSNRKLTSTEEFNFRVDRFHDAEREGKVSEDSFTNYFLDQMRKRIAADDQEKERRIQAQNQLADLRARLTEQTLTSTQREDVAIDARYADEMAQIKKLAVELHLTAGEEQQMNSLALAGWQKQRDAIDTFSGRIKSHIMTIQSLEENMAESFASGLANAFVAFASGTESASQAFKQFAAQFLQMVAEMILQMLILRALSGIFGAAAGGASGGASAAGGLSGGTMVAASGGIFPRKMADGGFAGLFSQATYFPRFNVIGGEAGTEMMAALARPTFRSLGGIDAVVGHAGPNRLALTMADDLASRGGAGGMIHIKLDMHPDLKAEIISTSVKGAQVQITQDMKRNSPISRAVKGLTA